MPNPKPVAIVKCKNKNCSTEFEQKRDWQKFCSKECRNEYHATTAREGKKLIEQQLEQ